MKRQIFNEHLHMKKNKSCQISRSFQKEYSIEKQQSTSLKKGNCDKSGSMQIVEMWSKKMKKQCDSYLESLKHKQEQEIKQSNYIPPIMLKNIDMMKRSDKTTLPRSRITSFNQQDFNQRSIKQIMQQNEEYIGTSIYSISNSGRSNAKPFFIQRNNQSSIRDIKYCIEQCDTLLQDVQSIRSFINLNQIDLNCMSKKDKKTNLKKCFYQEDYQLMQQLYTLDNMMPKQFFDYCIKKYNDNDYKEKEMIVNISEQAMKEIQILNWFHQFHNKQP